MSTLKELIMVPGVSKGRLIISLIAILLMGVICSYIYVLSVYVSPLNEAHGWSMNSIVLAYSIAMFVAPFAFAFSKPVADKFGRKNTLIGMGVIYGLAIAASGLTSSVIVFIIAQGIICSFAMYAMNFCMILLINIIWPNLKSTVMGIMYGCSTFGGALLAPIAVFFIGKFSVGTALVIQGLLFAVIMLICGLLIWDPSKGNKKLAEQMDEESEQLGAEFTPPAERISMPIKKVVRHPSIYIYIISIILIQLIGNLLVTDASALATMTYAITEAKAALAITMMNIGAGFGGIICGFMGDRVGHFKLTFWLGVLDGVLIVILGLMGLKTFGMFVALCTIQGFTYNGITALNPAMNTVAWGEKSLGTTMAMSAIGTIIVAFIGPQLGFMVSMRSMLLICGLASAVGGILALLVAKTCTSYYKSVGSDVVVR